MLVLSRYTIQFGQYRGQTFKWLLENAVGYTAYLVDSHQKEQEHTACQSMTPMMANKDDLTRYSRAFPDFVKEVRFHRGLEEAKVRSLPPGQEGQDLVGFGKYQSETLQSLYESKDEDKISYVNFLRRMTSDPGTKMEAAIKYICSRDQAGNAAAAAATMAATASTRPARKTTIMARRAASKKLVQATRVQHKRPSRPGMTYRPAPFRSNCRQRNPKRRQRRTPFRPLSFLSSEVTISKE
ncbi:uncharacterized protein [Centroberyx affinis]|uniref:uncharacterized protein n=1 Tax=Centroberyx affinis TaxID=166261 RepID=UPI003A5BA544